MDFAEIFIHKGVNSLWIKRKNDGGITLSTPVDKLVEYPLRALKFL
ncbi:hypothetical protein CGERO_10780 [Corynebacterium gerontici]|uniref:Uncharacterized protein n=1 Tax=Corynebacterium gerontici TaxID=2079234 RepID=A0A3G6J304_9CORY|nr:hypothetical protein CGERO_10780 [Corynebacterium gerontici]